MTDERTNMVLVSADLRFELDGVLADMDVGREFGAVCRATIVRVRDALTPGASNAEGQALAEVETPASRERPAPSAPSKSNGGFLCVGECQHYINEHGLAERALRASAGERERADELGRDLSAAVEDTNVEARKLVRAFGELTAERERAERWKQEASIWRADLTRLQAEVEGLREALGAFLQLHTNAPGFVRAFTLACAQAKTALKGEGEGNG